MYVTCLPSLHTVRAVYQDQIRGFYMDPFGCTYRTPATRIFQVRNNKGFAMSHDKTEDW
jgi:hypothetical protein